jgi:hypothetical protein
MIRMTRDPSDRTLSRYVIEPDTMLTRAMLDAVLSWGRPRELAAMAEQRRGFSNNDGGFGVVYHGDLDEFDHVNCPIREGHVQVYGFYGPPEGYEHEIEERAYLEFLSAFLRANNLVEDAERVERLAARLPG